jgi:hypothetical protein
MTKNDDLWAELVQKLNLNLTHPVNELRETEIKVALEGRRDLRLLVSMDTEEKLASVLRSHGTFVLPRSRTEWVVVRGKGYQKLEDPGEPERFRSRLPIRLTTAAYGHGESRFLFHAFNSGLLSHFSGTKDLFPTLAGKGATPRFHFKVNGHCELDVDGAGMEVDMVFESLDPSVLLFEAKVGWKDTFLIRQLYYPYRSHRDFQESGGHKRVRPFFFVAEPERRSYSIWEFEWTDPNDYEAIQLVPGRARRYEIEEQPVPADLLAEIPPDPSVPEIQANDLVKVTSLPFLIPQGINTARKWADYYGFAVRQGNYYESAAEVLGLVTSEGGTFVLTDEGKRFVTLAPEARDTLVAERLLKIPTFNRVFALAHERGSAGVGDGEIASIISDSRHLTGKTPPRRASSVRSWFRWLAQATGAVVVDEQRIFSRQAWEKNHPAGRDLDST